MTNRALVPWGVALVLSAMLGDATSAEVRWIQGSWVNIRKAASNNAAVVEHLIVNTEVSLLSQQGNWCEIAVQAPETHGYATCSMLGRQMVSLEEVRAESLDQGKPNPRYSATRAFWLAPSVIRLQAAGDHYWKALLSESQKAKERPQAFDEKGNPTSFNWDKRPNPVRYAIPEYEAMKNLLKRGVVAAPERKPSLMRWSELQQAAKANPNGEIMLPNRWLPDGVTSMLRTGRLSMAKTSLFKREGELASASAGVEELSAQFGIVERLKVLSGPKWVYFRNEDPGVRGNWDIGSFEITLEKPVIEYAIGRKGLASAREWTASFKFDVTADSGCDGGFSLAPKANKPLPDYPTVKAPMVWLYFAKPLPFKKVRVSTVAKKLDQPNDNSYSPYGVPTMLFMHEIDIDGDGVADLAVWEGMLHDGNGGDILGTRLVFANIGGEWFLLDSDYMTECT